MPEAISLPDGRMSPQAAGEYLGVAWRTLSHWRWVGTGPRAVKVSGKVWYYKKDLDKWVREQSRVVSA